MIPLVRYGHVRPKVVLAPAGSLVFACVHRFDSGAVPVQLEPAIVVHSEKLHPVDLGLVVDQPTIV